MLLTKEINVYSKRIYCGSSFFVYGAENEAYKLRVWGNEVDCFLCQRVMTDLC